MSQHGVFVSPKGKFPKRKNLPGECGKPESNEERGDNGRRVSQTHQFTIQATSIAVEFVVEPPTPERRVCRSAICTFALDTPGRRVAGVVRTVVVAGWWGGRWALTSSGFGCRWTCSNVCCCARCGSCGGRGKRRRTHDLVFTHGGKSGGN